MMNFGRKRVTINCCAKHISMPHSNARFDVALQSPTQLEVKIVTPFQNKQVLATQLESKSTLRIEPATY